MVHSKIIVVLAVALLLSFSCGCSDVDTPVPDPENTLKQYLDGCNEGNVTKIYDAMPSDAHLKISKTDLYNAMADTYDVPQIVEYKVNSKVIVEDSAYIIFEMIIYHVQAEPQYNTFVRNVSLVLEDGEWKILDFCPL